MIKDTDRNGRRKIAAKLIWGHTLLFVAGLLIIIFYVAHSLDDDPATDLSFKVFVFGAGIFAASWLLKVAAYKSLGLPWNGRVKRYTPEQIRLQNEALQLLSEAAGTANENGDFTEEGEVKFNRAQEIIEKSKNL